MLQSRITIPMAQYAIENPDLLSQILDQHAELEWQRALDADLERLVTKQGETIAGQQSVISDLEDRVHSLNDELILSADRIQLLESFLDDYLVRRGGYAIGN